MRGADRIDMSPKRKQNTDRGFPDFAESYTYHLWVRNLDRAALGRKVLIAPAMGFPEFMRPAFNEDRDPGPPTLATAARCRSSSPSTPAHWCPR